MSLPDRAEPDQLEFALRYVLGQLEQSVRLNYSGKDRLKRDLAADVMARRLADHLRRANFQIERGPPTPLHTSP